MCGIAVAVGGTDPLGAVRAMVAAQRHRGPDAQDDWLDDEARVALGHDRLAIRDLSDAGRQPMADAAGRYVLTFNGEIYNGRRAARAARRPVDLSQHRRYRGAARGLGALGCGVPRPADRHVRVRALGPPGARPVAGAGPLRGQTALSPPRRRRQPARGERDRRPARGRRRRRARPHHLGRLPASRAPRRGGPPPSGAASRASRPAPWHAFAMATSTVAAGTTDPAA